MTNPVEQTQEPVVGNQTQDDKEYNFAKIRKQLDQEKIARKQAEERLAELEALSKRQVVEPEEEDEEDDEPYIDKKRLKKEFKSIAPKIKEEAKNDIRQEVARLMEEERKAAWLRENPDFEEVMDHAQKFADKKPGLAQAILKMPESFERYKLVYENIKALGLHEKEQPKPTIQETIDRNKRSPYYQPSGSASPPYAAAADFSPAGQKAAYAKIKELQARMGIR